LYSDLVDAVVDVAGAEQLLEAVGVGYVAPDKQQELLSLAAGMLPPTLSWLQVFVTDWLGAAFLLQTADAGTRAAGSGDCSPDGKACGVCYLPVLRGASRGYAELTGGVACAAAGCDAAFHTGCVVWSVRSGPAANPLRQQWRCHACAAFRATGGAPGISPAAAAAATPHGGQQPEADAAARVHAAQATTAPVAPRAVDCGQVEDAVRGLSVADAWEWVEAARWAAHGAARRFLPGRAGAEPPYARRLAAGVVTTVLKAAVGGHAAAQIIALWLPRIMFRRGMEIPAQVAAFAANHRPSPAPARDSATARDMLAAWCARVGRAVEAGDIRAACTLLEQGEGVAPFNAVEESPWLDRLFPHSAEGEVQPGSDGDDPSAAEHALWSRSSAPFVDHDGPQLVTARDVVSWARAKAHKAADAGGWSGQMVLDLVSTDSSIAVLLASLWSLPPQGWVDRRARNFALRSATGVLLRQQGRDKPRPVAAPTVARRVATAAAARKARALTAAFCEERGQLGLSGGGALTAYAMIPHLMVKACGATTVSADLEAAFQSMSRDGLVRGALACLASDAAVGRPAAASALVTLAGAAVFDTPLMSRTTTSFASGAERVSHALCQGCSSSPTLCAVALAAAAKSHAPAEVGVVRLSAHDDYQATAMPGVPTEALRPPDPGVGARYNPKKSVAVGPGAAEAVARGIAATAAPYASVFGVPVGDTARWVREVWMPKQAHRVDAIRRVARHAPDVAILTAVAIGGPGAAGVHWMAHVRCWEDEAVMQQLRDADRMWIDLFVSLAGLDPVELRRDAPHRAAAVRSRVFGAGPACLGHRSAAEAAEATYWAGLRRAWPIIRARVADAGVPSLLGDLLVAAGVPPAVPADGVAAWVAVRAEEEAAALAAVRTRLAKECSGVGEATAWGATSSPEAVLEARPNLRVEALRASRWQLAGQLSKDGRGGPISLAILFGLPLWPALGLPSPSHCPRCLAPAHVTVGGAGVAEDGPHCGANSRPGVRAVLDDGGEHVAACLLSGPAAGPKRRHDGVVRDLAQISSGCGRTARYHDGPIFRFGRKSRPADWLEGRVCHDLVIGARSVMCATAREREKTRKYAVQMAEHPAYVFRPFGAENGGEIGPVASATVADWSRALAAARKVAMLPVGNPAGDVRAAVGRAFVRASISQVMAWAGKAARVVTA
jgi:hypothetical protein